MRVICISNIEEDKELDLVVGKVYEIQSKHISTYYLIKSNEPNEFTYNRIKQKMYNSFPLLLCLFFSYIIYYYLY